MDTMEYRDLDKTYAQLRKDYGDRPLNLEDVDRNPFNQFSKWVDEAVQVKSANANAMTLATARKDGQPSVRVVLLKGFDDQGLVFFTDYASRKGREIAENAKAALLLFWPELNRQVVMAGGVEKINQQDSDHYFESRPRGAQIAASVSKQSQFIESRDMLKQKVKDFDKSHADQDIPVPSNWGGYRVIPHEIEFWQGRQNRLNDRIIYKKQADGSWTYHRLQP